MNVYVVTFHTNGRESEMGVAWNGSDPAIFESVESAFSHAELMGKQFPDITYSLIRMVVFA